MEQIASSKKTRRKATEYIPASIKFRDTSRQFNKENENIPSNS